MQVSKTAGASGLIGAILASVILIEGGYSNNPLDPGGETKYGITARVAREYGYTGSMKDLSLEKANEIYTAMYVKGPRFDLVLEQSPAIGHKLIDAGINVGTARISKWFQQSLNAYSRGGTDYPKIKEDGSIGPATLAAYKSLEETRGKVLACSLVLKALDSLQGSYYLSLTHMPAFTTGWMDKRIQSISLDQCKEYTLIKPDQIRE